MKLRPLRFDVEAGCRNLIHVVDALTWLPAGLVVLGLMALTFVIGRISK